MSCAHYQLICDSVFRYVICKQYYYMSTQKRISNSLRILWWSRRLCHRTICCGSRSGWSIIGPIFDLSIPFLEICSWIKKSTYFMGKLFLIFLTKTRLKSIFSPNAAITIKEVKIFNEFIGFLELQWNLWDSIKFQMGIMREK